MNGRAFDPADHEPHREPDHGPTLGSRDIRARRTDGGPAGGRGGRGRPPPRGGRGLGRPRGRSGLEPADIVAALAADALGGEDFAGPDAGAGSAPAAEAPGRARRAGPVGDRDGIRPRREAGPVGGPAPDPRLLGRLAHRGPGRRRPGRAGHVRLLARHRPPPRARPRQRLLLVPPRRPAPALRDARGRRPLPDRVGPGPEDRRALAVRHRLESHDPRRTRHRRPAGEPARGHRPTTPARRDAPPPRSQRGGRGPGLVRSDRTCSDRVNPGKIQGSNPVATHDAADHPADKVHARHHRTAPLFLPTPRGERRADAPADPAGGARRAAAAAGLAPGDAGARMGRGRRRARLGRRLRRSPGVRDGHPRARAGGGRVPGGDPAPARLADAPSRGGRSAGRACSSASAPGTWTA